MKLFCLFAAVQATNHSLECYAEQDKFDLGFSDMAIRPVCDPNNSKSGFNNFYATVLLVTYNFEVQCDAVQCSCTNPVTGAPAEPARQFKVAAKDVMVCSGTKCLIQNENAYKMTLMGIADANGPACDVFGNYMMVQCGMLGCYCESKDGEWSMFAGEQGIDYFIPEEEESAPLFCLKQLKENGWTRDGPIAATTPIVEE